MLNISDFTELLFADQSLDQLLVSTNRDELGLAQDGWTPLAEAARFLHLREGARALELLTKITGDPMTGTRVLLWSWTALRSLGVWPKSDDAVEVKGAVLQVPIHRGVDVLAAYADGTARYVNHSGKIVVWDLADPYIRKIVHTLLERCKDLGVGRPASFSERTDGSAARVTILTTGGNRIADFPQQSFGESPIRQVLSVGAELIANLSRRTESMNNLVQQLPASPSRRT